MKSAGKLTVNELLAHDQPETLIEKLSFEDGMTLLEELCSGIEGGGMSLDSAVVSYERGVKLVEHLKGKLALAESKIQMIGGGTLEV
jgi:exodeoxyribonuclease VII small subunit